MNKKDIILGEIIGKKAEVTKSTSKEKQGIKGIIIDETMKTIVIENEKGETKTIQKKGTTFKINGVEIQGKEIAYRPEERTKKNWRKFK